MKWTRTLGVLAAGMLTASAALAGELDLAIKAMSGQQASFTQKFLPKGFKNEQKESGTVTFGTPPQMRWSYAGAEARLFVFDGNTSWLYTPSEKQVVIKSLTAQEKRDLPFAFLWSGGATSNFSVKEKRNGQLVTVTLTPKQANATVKAITLQVGAADHRIRSVSYSDTQGNRTSFEFSGFKAAGSTSFQFQVPQGVEVIRQ